MPCQSSSSSVHDLHIHTKKIQVNTNNHAVEHYKKTGYPLAVKLGTITADLETADVFSYPEDENNSTKIPILNGIESKKVGQVKCLKHLKVPDETELVDDDGQNKSLLMKTNGYLVKEPEQISPGGISEVSSEHLKVPDETELVDDDGQNEREGSLDCSRSDDATSEVDDYMDALATIDSELEIDNECGPKKSFLNVQKVIDSNGEEEHQLQAPFSDSQSFGDSSLSEEMSSFEQDRSEENNEVQAQLPDSRSAGTPCASDDDNRSFRKGRIEEHTQLQAQLSDFQSIGNSSPETKNMPSDQLSQAVELQKNYDEFVTHDDAHDLRREISDSGPVSSGSCPVDSECLLLSSDYGAKDTSLVSLPTRTLSDNTPDVPVEHLRLEDDEDTIYPIKDDTLPVVDFDNNSLNLDVCNPHVHSHTLLQVSNDLNLAHEGECGGHSDIEVMQEESLNEYCSELSVVGDIGSRGEDPICLPMELDLNSGTKLQLDDWDLQSNSDVKAMQLDSEDLFPVVETTIENSFAEELFSKFIHGNPQDEPDSAFKFRRDDDIMVNDIFPVKVMSKDLAVSVIPSLDNAETDTSIVNCQASNSIFSPSMNPSNLLESFPASPDSNRMEMGSNEVELTKFSTDLNVEKRENQLEPFAYITSPLTDFPAHLLTTVTQLPLTA
ncbi:unnamed protein product [Vicia faba]|uniref:Protein SCAR n=1 Tax=Vicia faba TaxID=3906 RepID=A0AAV0ZAU1_VICFA|nr:unnamed protein product [Vicia faba]